MPYSAAFQGGMHGHFRKRTPRAGHRGRRGHRARHRAHFPRRGRARLHLRHRRQGARRARQGHRPHTRRRREPRGRGPALRRVAEGARRPGRARQQRRHRRSDRQGRGHRAGGLGPLHRHRSHRHVQLHAQGDAAAQGRGRRQHRQPLFGCRPPRLSAAHALRGREMGRGRLHQEHCGRGRPRQGALQRHPAGPRRGRAHRARDRREGEGARRAARAVARRSCSPPPACTPRSRRRTSPTWRCSCAPQAGSRITGQAIPVDADVRYLV